MKLCAPARISAPAVVVEEEAKTAEGEGDPIELGELDIRKQKLNFALIPDKIDDVVRDQVDQLMKAVEADVVVEAPKAVVAVPVVGMRPSGRSKPTGRSNPSGLGEAAGKTKFKVNLSKKRKIG
jgi:hypothetical protein